MDKENKDYELVVYVETYDEDQYWHQPKRITIDKSVLEDIVKDILVRNKVIQYGK